MDLIFGPVKQFLADAIHILSLGEPTDMGQAAIEKLRLNTRLQKTSALAARMYFAFTLIPSRTADSYLTGTLKRSPSYASEYGTSTIRELEDLVRRGDQKAGKMLKLVKQAARLQQKVGGK
jgi:hypothetical protein